MLDVKSRPQKMLVLRHAFKEAIRKVPKKRVVTAAFQKGHQSLLLHFVSLFIAHKSVSAFFRSS